MADMGDPGSASALSLAYIGDAVFELYIRSRITAEHVNFPVDRLHRKVVSYVKASSQSNIIHGIWECLTEKEKRAVKKGRNTKSGSSPKNAAVVDYRYATGYETLLGYLFVKGDIHRLMEILNMSYDILL